MPRPILIGLLALLGFVLPVRADDAAAPEGWRFFAAREEIAPKHGVATDGGGYALSLAGVGDRSVDGRWVRRVPVVGGHFVVFAARYRAKDVETPARSVVASVLWYDAKGKQVEQAEFPLTVPGADAQGWSRMTATYRVPEAAREAQL
jgi:hypothetical protein